MARKFTKHNVIPDLLYDSELVSKFVNQIMRRGKKTIASKIIYRTLEIIKEKTKKEPLVVMEEALRNAAPLLEVRPKRVGGATYQVPVEVKGDRKIALAMRWIIQAAKKQKGRPMAEKLSDELILASNNDGFAVKKKLDTHRMAEANRAFAHFAQ
jgi:small subunit ribosomal protein S7